MRAPRHTECEVLPVKTRSDWNRFHSVPFQLQGEQANWVPPLKLQARQIWAPRHPFFRHADARAWLAVRDKRVVGRISAQVDHLQQSVGRDDIGQFGQLEAVDDPVVFDALLDQAGAWLKGRGKRRMEGPFDLSINQQCGILIDGFDQASMMMMPYNPPYYPERLEAAGFKAVVEMLAYRGCPDFALPARVAKLISRLQGRFAIRPVRRADAMAQAETMRRIFNASWANNWGFVPLTCEEFRHMVAEMKILLRPGYVHLAICDGKPAGFIVGLPDLNELIADLRGRLWPTGAIRLLWRIARKTSTRARIPLMGISPEFHQTPLGAAMAYMLIESIKRPLIADGVKLTEQSWILQQNQGMRAIVESIGMHVAQRFHVYARAI